MKRFKKGFFPVNAFGGREADKTFNLWYGKHLRAMNERSLLDNWDSEVYRFLWLRTFDHPVVVRVQRNGLNLVSVELNGAGGYEPGTRWRKDNVAISQDDWRSFTALLEKASFWSMETNSPDDIGRDGSQWVLEGLRGGRYHIVDRWTPVSGDYREACLFLLKLSGREPSSLGQDLY